MGGKADLSSSDGKKHVSARWGAWSARGASGEGTPGAGPLSSESSKNANRRDATHAPSSLAWLDP